MALPTCAHLLYEGATAPLPDLVEVPCAVCGGDAWLETYTGDPTRCEGCDATGYALVCPVCGEVPTADTDLCGCPQTEALNPCEICDRWTPVGALNSAGICAECHQVGVAELQERRARFATSEAEGLDWARKVGWLPCL